MTGPVVIGTAFLIILLSSQPLTALEPHAVYSNYSSEALFFRQDAWGTFLLTGGLPPVRYEYPSPALQKLMERDTNALKSYLDFKSQYTAAWTMVILGGILGASALLTGIAWVPADTVSAAWQTGLTIGLGLAGGALVITASQLSIPAANNLRDAVWYYNGSMLRNSLGLQARLGF